MKYLQISQNAVGVAVGFCEASADFIAKLLPILFVKLLPILLRSFRRFYCEASADFKLLPILIIVKLLPILSFCRF